LENGVSRKGWGQLETREKTELTTKKDRQSNGLISKVVRGRADFLQPIGGREGREDYCEKKKEIIKSGRPGGRG